MGIINARIISGGCLIVRSTICDVLPWSESFRLIGGDTVRLTGLSIINPHPRRLCLPLGGALGRCGNLVLIMIFLYGTFSSGDHPSAHGRGGLDTFFFDKKVSKT